MRLTIQQCFNALYKYSKGRIYEPNAFLRHMGGRAYTPLGEVIEQGKDPREVYRRTFPRLRLVK